MKRLGKFVLTVFLIIGALGFNILTIIWTIVSGIVCGLAALLALPMALITKSNKCLRAIAAVWVILLALPAKAIGMEKMDLDDYSPKIANKLREKGLPTTAYTDDNINGSKELIKDYWNDEES